MSMNVSVAAYDASGASMGLLGSMKSLSLLATIDSPAEIMSAVFAPKKPFGEINSVAVYDNSGVLFSGMIDSQKSSVSSGGVTVRLEARNRGAYLLDNQSAPAVYIGIPMNVVFGSFIAPYGFTMYNPHRNMSLPMFTVGAATSEWEVFADFAQRTYGVTPYVTGTTVNLARRPSGSPLAIGADVAYTSLTHSRTPYNVISRVYLRDETTGRYPSHISNTYRAASGIRRKRYMSVPNEYSYNRSFDPMRRVRQSMLEYESIVAELPGIIPAELGRDAYVADGLVSKAGLMVSAREYSVDESGVFTRLTLIDPAYYK